MILSTEKSYKILIIDDSDDDRLIYTKFLTKSQPLRYKFVEAETIEEGLELLDEIRPDCILLDYQLPDGTGLSFLDRAGARYHSYEIRVIMLTSYGNEEVIVDAMQKGAMDYISKGKLSPELLSQKVYRAIEKGEILAELENSRQRLFHQATHDPLTGLLNRRAIFDHLHKELSRTTRLGESLVVGICDLDHFKQVNDTYGHKTGDDVLCGFSKILVESLREYDFVGRIGGEEFLIISPVKDVNDRSSLFDRVRTMAADTKIPTKSGLISISVSIGVAFTESCGSVDDVLVAADAALYQAKDQGRNRVVYASDSNCGGSG